MVTHIIVGLGAALSGDEKSHDSPPLHNKSPATVAAPEAAPKADTGNVV